MTAIDGHDRPESVININGIGCLSSNGPSVHDAQMVQSVSTTARSFSDDAVVARWAAARRLSRLIAEELESRRTAGDG